MAIRIISSSSSSPLVAWVLELAVFERVAGSRELESARGGIRALEPASLTASLIESAGAGGPATRSSNPSCNAASCSARARARRACPRAMEALMDSSCRMLSSDLAGCADDEEAPAPEDAIWL
jgi:hypothetical protein